MHKLFSMVDCLNSSSHFLQFLFLCFSDQKSFSGQKRTGEPQNEKEMETLKTNV